MKKIRWVIKLLFLLLFLNLLVYTRFPLPRFLPVNLFFRLNPLISLNVFLSSRNFILLLLPGIFLLLLFLFIKRKYFCQWFCPLGTILESSRIIVRRAKWPLSLRNPPRVSSYLFGFFLGLSILSLPLVGILEPFSLLFRGLSFQNIYFTLLLFLILIISIIYPNLWCAKVCPLGGLLSSISKRGKNSSPDFSRRAFLLSILGGMALSPFLRLKRENPRLLRPPGAREERDFLARCIRCGECMKVCPSGTLHPSLWEGGIAGFWTPRLIPRVAGCVLCFSCSQVCPTEAIKKVHSLQEVKIGTARIERERCLSWKGKLCLICMKVCPVRAVQIDEKGRPHVHPGKCIGCGQCEEKCPVEGDAAIKVYAIKV